MDEKVNVLVIGAGIMGGHSIAQDFAAHGYPTTLYDQSAEQLETAKMLIAGNLQLLKDEGMITDEGIKNVKELLV